MAIIELFKVFGSILVDNSGANQQLDATDKKAAGVANTLGAGIKTAAKWGLGIAGAAAAAGGALGGLVAKAVQASGEISKFSQVTGMSTKGFQQWDFVMKSVGYSMEQASGDLAALAEKAMDAANGVGEGAEMFGMLGLSVTDANGKLKGQEQLFNEVIYALQGMEDVTKRNAIATAMLSTTGEELGPILNMNNKELQQLKANAVVIADEDIKRAEKFRLGWEKAKAVFTGLVTQVGLKLLPTFEKLLQFTVEQIPKIGPVFEFVGDVVEIVVRHTSKALKPFLDMIAGISTMVWSWTVDKLGNGWEWLSGDAWTWVKDKAWPTLKQSFSTAWNWTAKQAGKAWDWLSGDAWDWITDTAWPTLISGLSVAWTWTATQAGKAWTWLSEDAWTWIKDAAWPTLTKALSTAWQWTAKTAGNAWTWLSEDAWNWIANTAWPTLTSGLSTAWKWTATQAGQAWSWLSGDAWDWIKDTAWPGLTSAISTAWVWTANRLGDAWDWLSTDAWNWLANTAWPSLISSVSTAWKWTATQAGKAWDWLAGDAWTWISDTAWPTLTNALAVAWKWTASTAGNAWDWLTTDAWNWIADTAWPKLTKALAVAWKWTATQAGKAWEWLSGDAWNWIANTAWPTLVSAINTAWKWTATQTGKAWTWLSTDAWDWISDTAWPALTGSLSVSWKWTATQAGKAWKWLSGPAWDWLSDTAWPALISGLSVAWKWTASRLGDAWDWLSEDAWAWLANTAWPSLTGAINTAWKWTAQQLGKAWTWLSEDAWSWMNNSAWPTLTSSLSVAWSWTAKQLGKAWDWLSGPVWEWLSDTAWPILTSSFSAAWTWSAELVDKALEWLKDTAWPYIDGTAATLWKWTVEFTGKTYEAIRKGFETGDWADALGIGSDLWSAGVLVAVGLTLARGAGASILASIAGVFGGGAAGAAASSLGGLGLVTAGAVGVLTVGIKLAEAWSTGDYNKFGLDLVAALAAGIGIGAFTGSPYAGALAFSVVMNFEIGTWIGDQLEALSDIKPGKLLEDFMGSESKKWENLSTTLDLTVDKIGSFFSKTKKETEALEGALDKIPAAAQKTTEGVQLWFSQQKLGPGFVYLNGQVKTAEEAFFELYDKVVGNSYVPDMVEEIGEAIARLKEKLANPVVEYTAQAVTAFANLEDEAKASMLSMAEAMDEALGSISNSVAEWVGSVSRDFFNGTATWSGVLGSFAGTIGGIFGTVFDAIAKEMASNLLKQNEWLVKTLSNIAVSITGYLSQAYATLTAFFAWSGPLAPVLAGGVIAAAIAGIASVGGSIARGLMPSAPSGGGGGADTSGSTSSGGGTQVTDLTGPSRDLLVDLLSPLASLDSLTGIGERIYNLLNERLGGGMASMSIAGVATAGGGGPQVTFAPGSVQVYPQTSSTQSITDDTVEQIERALAERFAFQKRGAGR